jgi:hypothetical protein
VEIDVPRAIGILNTLLRRLEEYNAVRVEPAARSYSDVAMVRELWPEQWQTANVPATNQEKLDGDTLGAELPPDERQEIELAPGDMDQDEKVAAE